MGGGRGVDGRTDELDWWRDGVISYEIGSCDGWMDRLMLEGKAGWLIEQTDAVEDSWKHRLLQIRWIDKIIKHLAE